MIFVLGGNGFVGSAYVRASRAQGRPCEVITRENYAEFVGRRCDVLVNANGNSKKFLAEKAPLEDFDASVRSVRASLVDFRYDTYVYLSTVDVYPDCSSPETTREEQSLDPARQSRYGFHKHLAEQCVRHVAGEWIIARLGGFVGPGLWKNAICDLLKGGPLWLDPASQLQFMHTDDSAAIVLELIERGVSREVFNVCGRGLISLQEVLDEVPAPVEVRAESPRVRYETSVEKLANVVHVPPTRETVLEFVRRAGRDARSTEAGHAPSAGSANRPAPHSGEAA